MHGCKREPVFGIISTLNYAICFALTGTLSSLVTWILSLNTIATSVINFRLLKELKYYTAVHHVIAEVVSPQSVFD